MNIFLIKNLIKIKNAYLFNKSFIVLDFCNTLEKMLFILYNGGFIQSYFHINKQQIIVLLKQDNENFHFKSLKLISTPSKIKYLNYLNICKLEAKETLLVFSTSIGLLTLEECKKLGVGGILLFKF